MNNNHTMPPNNRINSSLTSFHYGSPSRWVSDARKLAKGLNCGRVCVSAHVFTSMRHASVRCLEGDKWEWERGGTTVERKIQSGKELVTGKRRGIATEGSLHLLQLRTHPHPCPAGESMPRHLFVLLFCSVHKETRFFFFFYCPRLKCHFIRKTGIFSTAPALCCDVSQATVSVFFFFKDNIQRSEISFEPGRNETITQRV